MKYLLVLQFRFDRESQFDRLINIAQALDKVIKFHSFVDGHDIGVNEFNIFIYSNEPREAFKVAKQVLDTYDEPVEYRAAFRLAAGSDYEILWPSELTTFSVK